MGDLLMSAPAISALKETFGCHITVLTSSMSKGIAAYMPHVDEVITWDVPWVKGSDSVSDRHFDDIVKTLKQKQFDGAVIFTVFSQSPLPTALMATLAGIPRRLAYCRENPYHLLSDWVPEKEPYSLLRHQVRRDLDLVSSVGARPADEGIVLQPPPDFEEAVKKKVSGVGVDLQKTWVVLHPGASEQKRQYPVADWIEAGRKITAEFKCQLIITGVKEEQALAKSIRDGIGVHAFSMAGRLSLEEFITLIRFAPLVISVNTGTIHIAAALHTKVIVLFALTNPQHAPWKSIGKVLPFSVDVNLQSRNEVLRFVHDKYFSQKQLSVKPDDIVGAVRELLIEKHEPLVEDLVLPFAHGTFHGMRSTLNFHEP